MAQPDIWKSDFDNVIAKGVSNQPCHSVAVDFIHDLGAMRFRRLDADVQGNTDLLGGVSFRHELQNLSFATG